MKVARLLGEILDRVATGETEDFTAVLKQHPDVAADLATALKTFDHVGTLAQAGLEPRRLGDFERVREIGRGGMGIVYEARQISLAGRPVALKVLPSAHLLDPRNVARFWREAKIAASLQHSHIVPVYTLGVEGGIPYFIMELCVGQTLNKILERLGARPADSGPVSSVGSLLLLSSKDAPRSPVGGLGQPGPEVATPSSPGMGPASPMPAAAGRGRFGSRRCAPRLTPAFYNDVAQLFAGAADGLQHAHDRKVIHRDIKPSNLMLDLDGRLRILDFSLAWLDGDQRLTLSQERLGTPLYMSPEQARGGSAQLGPATDVYSLGATLYEVLTGAPPFEGKDWHDTLRRVQEDELTPPRRRNRQIPRDLQTIVVACLRKDPAERYATAGDLAEDLRAFARGGRIKMRPRPLVERLGATASRYRRTIASCAALLVVLGVSSGVYHERERRASCEAEVLEAVKALMRPVLRLGQDAKTSAPAEGWVLDFNAGKPILGALEREQEGMAVVLVAGCELIDPETREGPGAPEADPEALNDLERAREHLQAAIGILPGSAEAHYYLARVLRDQGKLQAAAVALARGGQQISDGTPAAEPATQGVTPSPVRGLWTRAFQTADDAFAAERWAAAARAFDEALARAGAVSSVKPHTGWTFETRVKAGVASLRANDLERAKDHLVSAQEIVGGMLEVELLLLKVHVLRSDSRSVAQAGAAVERYYARADEPERGAIAPAVVRAYLDLGEFTKSQGWIHRVEQGPARDALEARLLRGRAMAGRQGDVETLSDAYRAARLTPNDLASRLCLGNVYLANHRFDEAETAFKRAMGLAPLDPRPPVGLGVCRWAQDDLDAARARLEDALALDARFASGHYNLGVVLVALGEEPAAEGSYRLSLELDPAHALAHNNLGAILLRRGQVREGALEMEQAVNLSPRLGLVRYNWGLVLQGQWQFREAVAEYREALKLGMLDPVVRKNLGFCLYWLRDYVAALGELKQAIAMDPGCARSRDRLGLTLYQSDRSEEAIAHLREAVQREPRWANAHNHLGLVLEEAGRAREGTIRQDYMSEALSEFLLAFHLDPAYVYAANDYTRLCLQERIPLAQGAERALLLGRLEELRHLPNAEEMIDRAIDECRRAAVPDLLTFRSIDAFLDAPETLIGAGEEWRYSAAGEPASSGIDWTSLELPDGDWAAGASAFGPGGETGVRTAIAGEPGPRSALHLRRRFVVPDLSRFQWLRLRVQASAGWIAYLNGDELGRFLAGPRGVRLPPSAVADTQEPQPGFARELTVPGTRLLQGENVLAIQALQAPDASVALWIDPTLLAVPRFDRTAAERVATGLRMFRAVANGPDAESRLAYAEGALRERLGQHAEAAAYYSRILAVGVDRPEPALGLARCLLARGQAPDAARGLLDRMDLTAVAHLPLWREWLRICLVELEQSPQAVLGALGEIPADALQAVRDGVWALEELAAARPLRINCGGPDSIDELGSFWSKDRLYCGGIAYFLHKLVHEHRGSPSARVYETERYYLESRSLVPGYAIPLPPGLYEVSLHFVEGHFEEPGSRSFDVELEGELVLKDYEPLRAGFGIPRAEARSVEVLDGVLNINFGRRVENPKLSAIEVAPLEP